MPLAPAFGSVLATSTIRSAMRPVGDERLGAVDDVVVAVAQCGGLDVLQVRARAGFGHRDGGDHLPAGHPGQPPSALLLGAVGQDVVRDDAAVHGNTEAAVQGPALRFEHGEVVRESAAAPAVLLGDRAAQQPESAGLEPYLAVDVLLRAS